MRDRENWIEIHRRRGIALNKKSLEGQIREKLGKEDVKVMLGEDNKEAAKIGVKD